MENKITLDDLMNKTADELVPSMSIDTKPTLKEVKKSLKDYFKAGNKHSIKANCHLPTTPDGNGLSYGVKITKVLPSTGRVFLEYEGKEFSVTLDYLTGEDTKLPFEVGDEVLDLKTNEIGTVSNIVKSSRKVHVDFPDLYAILPASRLQKMEKE